jgi:uncharacterized membrane protein
VSIIKAVVAATAAGAAVTGGVFYGFSSFVMPALRAMPDRDGTATMQAINQAAPRSLLMLPLLGAAAGSVTVAAHALLVPGPGRVLRLAGAVAYLASFALTVAYHVPRNNALAELDPVDPATATAWTAYARDWTRWNHARTATAMLAALALVVAPSSQTSKSEPDQWS